MPERRRRWPDARHLAVAALAIAAAAIAGLYLAVRAAGLVTVAPELLPLAAMLLGGEALVALAALAGTILQLWPRRRLPPLTGTSAANPRAVAIVLDTGGPLAQFETVLRAASQVESGAGPTPLVLASATADGQRRQALSALAERAGARLILIVGARTSDQLLSAAAEQCDADLVLALDGRHAPVADTITRAAGHFIADRALGCIRLPGFWIERHAEGSPWRQPALAGPALRLMRSLLPPPTGTTLPALWLMQALRAAGETSAGTLADRLAMRGWTVATLDEPALARFAPLRAAAALLALERGLGPRGAAAAATATCGLAAGLTAGAAGAAGGLALHGTMTPALALAMAAGFPAIALLAGLAATGGQRPLHGASLALALVHLRCGGAAGASATAGAVFVLSGLGALAALAHAGAALRPEMLPLAAWLGWQAMGALSVAGILAEPRERRAAPRYANRRAAQLLIGGQMIAGRLADISIQGARFLTAAAEAPGTANGFGILWLDAGTAERDRGFRVRLRSQRQHGERVALGLAIDAASAAEFAAAAQAVHGSGDRYLDASETMARPPGAVVFTALTAWQGLKDVAASARTVLGRHPAARTGGGTGDQAAPRQRAG